MMNITIQMIGSVQKGSHMFGNPNQLPGLSGRAGGVQYQQRNNGPPLAPSILTADTLSGSVSERRVELLEQRLAATEQTNRSLQEQWQAQQQHMKMAGDGELRREQQLRLQLETSLKNTHFQLQQLELKVARYETKTNDCHGAVMSIQGQIGSLEKNVLHGSTGNSQAVCDDNLRKMVNMSQELSHIKRSRLDSDKQLLTFQKDIQQLSIKVDSLSSEMQSLQLARTWQHDVTSSAGSTARDNATMSLEAKITRLQNQSAELQAHMMRQSREHTVTEDRLNDRIDQLSGELASLTKQRDLAARLEQDSKVLETSSTDSSTASRRHPIAPVVNKVSDARQPREKELDSYTQPAPQSRDYNDRELQIVENSLEKEEKKNAERLQQLSTAIEHLESSYQQQKLETDREMRAEIQERKKLENMMHAKVDDIGDRLRLGMAALQSGAKDRATGAHHGHKIKNIDKGNGSRATDQQTAQHARKLATLEEQVDQQVRETKRLQDDITAVKGPDYQQIPNMGQLQKYVEDNKTSFRKLSEVLQIVKSETTAQIKREMKTREQQVELLRQDVDLLEERVDDMEDTVD